MTDITKCLNERCPQRQECYRFTAPQGARQSMGWFKPDLKTGQCDHFLGELFFHIREWQDVLRQLPEPDSRD